MVGALSIAALPPSNGFVSEWLTLQTLALTAGLAVTCFVKAFAMGFLGMARSKEAAEAVEAPKSMTVPRIGCSVHRARNHSHLYYSGTRSGHHPAHSCQRFGRPGSAIFQQESGAFSITLRICRRFSSIRGSARAANPARAWACSPASRRSSQPGRVCDVHRVHARGALRDDRTYPIARPIMVRPRANGGPGSSLGRRNSKAFARDDLYGDRVLKPRQGRVRSNL